MNNHQAVLAEIDALAENFTICVNLGKDLIHRRHPRSQEVVFNYFILHQRWSLVVAFTAPPSHSYFTSRASDIFLQVVAFGRCCVSL